jgi:hypothetical protein
LRKKRYGKANEHNGKVPRDFWLEELAVVPQQQRLERVGRHPQPALLVARERSQQPRDLLLARAAAAARSRTGRAGRTGPPETALV